MIAACGAGDVADGPRRNGPMTCTRRCAQVAGYSRAYWPPRANAASTQAPPLGPAAYARVGKGLARRRAWSGRTLSR